MLDNLLNLVKAQVGDALSNHPEVPKANNAAVINTTADSIVSGLQQQLSSGNVGDVLKLLGGKSSINQSSAVAKISSQVVGDLSAKAGLSTSQAGSLVTSVLPGILQSIIKKTNDPNDKSIDLGSIFGSLTEGKTQGLDLNKFLDKDGDGSSLDDLASLITGGGKNAEGGIGKMLGGLFGKKE